MPREDYTTIYCGTNSAMDRALCSFFVWDISECDAVFREVFFYPFGGGNIRLTAEDGEGDEFGEDFYGVHDWEDTFFGETERLSDGGMERERRVQFCFWDEGVIVIIIRLIF